MGLFDSKFNSKSGASIPRPNAPVVRRESRPVPKPQASSKPLSQRSSSTPQPPPFKAVRSSVANGSPPRAKSLSKSSPSPKQKLVVKDRMSVVRNGESKKRKSTTPATPAFSSDSEGTSSQDGSDFLDISRKRIRTETRSPDTDNARIIRDLEAWAMKGEGEGIANVVAEGLIHGSDLTKDNLDKFVPVFETEDASIAEIELQYPCPGQKEKFQLQLPKEIDGYRPLEDISETITEILTHYLPESISEEYLDPSRGIPYRLSRAVKDHSLSSYTTVISEFNALIEDHLSSSNNTIADHIDKNLTRVPLPLIIRLLNQTYARTVSPNVESLRKYENGTDNVYGELNYPFVSSILRQDTRLKSSHMFMDLGSGVGNVVLQAALETGCDAYGIEMMSNPSKLADAQLVEFRARCKLWGLKAGNVTLHQGDFLEDTRVFERLPRADAVLVNNQAFLPELNERISSYLFLELKDGVKVISLRSFQPGGQKARNSNAVMNMFKEKSLNYYRNWVSWMDSGGKYYVVEKDLQRMAGLASN